MIRLLTALAMALTLSACGGGGGGSTPTETVVSDTVNMAGTWTYTGELSPCPGLSASYIADLNDTDGNGVIDTLVRYNGNLIDSDTCQLEPFDGETFIVTEYGLLVNASQSNFEAAIREIEADYYGVDANDLDLTISIFESDQVSYTVSGGGDWEKVTMSR